MAMRWRDQARRGLKLASDRLPRHLPVVVGRRLIAQANAARDARLFEVAASLYEEALRFQPRTARFHMQAGHMYKEARLFSQAEAHYQAARTLEPGNAEFALQLGHFYKVAGRGAAAAGAYTDALTLQPGWREAVDELARAETGDDAPSGEAPVADLIIPELLPREHRDAPQAPPEMLRMLRVGGRARSRGGMLKLLRGIEAVRGFAISATPIVEVQVLIDGVVWLRAAPRDFALPGATDRKKYVFNIWADFTHIPVGRHELDIRVVWPNGRYRRHVEQVTVAPPLPADAAPGSDSFIPLVVETGRAIDEQVNALPSMIRPARRSPLPQHIRTILVQRADQLGDLVCSVPAVRRLRALFPVARLVGLLTAANAGLGETLGVFDEIVVADFAEDQVERRRTMSRESQAALRQTLHALDIDLAIDLGEGQDSRLLLLLSGARFTWGFKEREFAWLSGGIELHSRDPFNGLETTPPSRKLLALVEALGILHHGHAEAVPVAVDRTALKDFGLAPERRYAVLHTGARLAYSRWPGFVALAQKLLAESDLDLVIFCEGLDDIADLEASDRVHLIRGAMAFPAFEMLLSGAAVFVGNDSGPKHLAALRGSPVVSLHMARLNWSEWGQEIGGTIISRRVPCAGCALTHDPEDCGKEFACIRAISVDEVFGATMALVAPMVG